MKLDLSKGVNILVGGEIGRYDTIPLEFFIRLAQNFQNLLFTLAKFEVITEGGIDLNNFRIELAGFGNGKAIPQFVYTKRMQGVTSGDVVEQRELVNESFDQLMAIANKGNYNKLKDIYRGPYKRNHIVEDLFRFIGGFGTTPVSFVNINKKGEAKPIYQVRRFHREMKDQLKTAIIDSRTDSFEEYYAFAKVKVTNKGGKIKNRIQEVFDNQESELALSYAPDEIVFNDKVYALNSPLRCLYEKENEFYVIKSELLGIMGTGHTEEDAEYNFFQEFDFIYTRFTDLPFVKLSPENKKVKILLDFLVKSVEEHGNN